MKKHATVVGDNVPDRRRKSGKETAVSASAFPSDQLSSDVPAVSLRRSTWTNSVLLIGIVVVVAIRFCGSWLMGILPASFWLRMSLSVFIPHLFLLCYPFLWRRQDGVNRYRLPKLTSLLKEAGIAMCVVIVGLMFAASVQYVVSQYTDVQTLTPRAIEQMRVSSPNPYTTLFMIGAIVIAPFSEEIFFRGFLLNALRRRMPLVVAVTVQSLAFGFIHTFGVVHGVGASLLGLVFSLLYLWRKSIVAPMMVHGLWNSIAVLALLASISGFDDAPVLGVIAKSDTDACVVESVMDGSPAEDAGLMPDDRIVKLDTHEISDFLSLASAGREFEVGDTVTVEFIRDGERMTCEVQLVSRREALENEAAGE